MFPISANADLFFHGSVLLYTVCDSYELFNRRSVDLDQLILPRSLLNGDEIEDLQKMGFDFGRFVSDLQY